MQYYIGFEYIDSKNDEWIYCTTIKFLEYKNEAFTKYYLIYIIQAVWICVQNE